MLPFRGILLICVALAGLRPAAHADDKLEIADFRARAGIITSVAISDDGKLVFTGEDDGLVTLWSVTTGTTAREFPFAGHNGSEVFAVALLPDGKRGISAGDDDQLIVWDLAAGKKIRAISTGNTAPVVMQCSPDGTVAAVGGHDGTVTIWRIDDGKKVATLDLRPMFCGLRFSPDGKVLATSDGEGRIILWDTAGWTQKRTLPGTPDRASIGALGFSMDGRFLATGNQCGAGTVWNVADGTRVCTFGGYEHPQIPAPSPVAPVFPGSVITPENRSAITYVCISPDGSKVLAPIQDDTPRFWDAKTGELLGTADWYEDTRFYYPRFGFIYSAAALTPKRDYIVTLKDNLAQVWRTSFKPNPPED